MNAEKLEGLLWKVVQSEFIAFAEDDEGRMTRLMNISDDLMDRIERYIGYDEMGQ